MVALLLDKMEAPTSKRRTNMDGRRYIGRHRGAHRDVVACPGRMKGADVAATDENGRTALHSAA